MWSLASLRRTKALDPVEFAIARFLVDYTLAGNPLPEMLPLPLIPFGYPGIISPFCLYLSINGEKKIVHPVVRKKLEKATVENSKSFSQPPTQKKIFRVDSSDISFYSMEQMSWKVADWSIWKTPEEVCTVISI